MERTTGACSRGFADKDTMFTPGRATAVNPPRLVAIAGRALVALLLSFAGWATPMAVLAASPQSITADPLAIKEALRAEFHAARLAGLSAPLRILKAGDPAKAGEAVVPVIEYFNAGLNHYFITADPAETAALDGGGLGGAWKRTGRSFLAWPANAGPAGSVPVCRFFGTDKYRSNGTRIGPNSHFYTADPVECAFVKTAYQSLASDGRSYPAWTFEGNAFSVILPAPGCPAGTEGLYRAYNNGANGDPNHRYSTDRALLAAMGGWTLEGLVMCVPAAAATAFDVDGPIVGCASPSCVPATDVGSGFALVDIVADLVNTGPAPTTVRIPAGFVFQSVTGAFQDGLLISAVEVNIPAAGRVRVMFRLYCMQASRHAADSNAVYVPASVTTNLALLDLVGLARGRLLTGGASSQSPKSAAVQFAVWEITDGTGTLSSNQRRLLDALLDRAESDPVLIDLLLEFQETLSYPME